MTSPSNDAAADRLTQLQQSTEQCLQLATQLEKSCVADESTFLTQLNQLRSHLKNQEHQWNEWTQNSRDKASRESQPQPEINRLIRNVTQLMSALKQLEHQLTSRREAIAPQIGRLREETRGRSEYLRAMK